MKVSILNEAETFTVFIYFYNPLSLFETFYNKSVNTMVFVITEFSGFMLNQ